MNESRDCGALRCSHEPENTLPPSRLRQPSRYRKIGDPEINASRSPKEREIETMKVFHPQDAEFILRERKGAVLFESDLGCHQMPPSVTETRQ